MTDDAPHLHLTRRRLIKGLSLSSAAALFDPVRTLAATADAPRRPSTLAEVLPFVRWDTTTQGTLIAVGPDRTGILRDAKWKPVPVPSPGSDGRWNIHQILPVFGRRLFPFGSLIGIAPIDMTLISETTPRREPPVWLGMSCENRILYLLSTLSEGQWQEVGSASGIGMSELTKDQQDAFLSTLPDPMVTHRSMVDEQGWPNYDMRQTSMLHGAERSQVRLRIQRSLQFMVADIGSRGGGGALLEPRFYGEPGDMTTELDLDAELDHPDSYGLTLKHIAANLPKTGDLDTAHPSFASPIPLEVGERVGALATRIGKMAGLELIADMRVAKYTVYARGAQASGGDLLRALSLAVTGTWRHVEGRTYVLTSDLIGAGSRRLRLALWQTELDAKAAIAERKWEESIAKNGSSVARHIGYAADDPLALSPEMDREAVRKSRSRDDGSLSTDLMSPATRTFLKQEAAEYSHQSANWDLSRVSVEREISARLILPDGTVLANNLHVGFASMLEPPDKAEFDPTGSQFPPGFKLPEGTFALPSGVNNRTVSLCAATEAEAITALQTARSLGFNTVYLRTEDEAIVRAAIAEGRRGDPGRAVAVGAIIATPFAARLGAVQSGLDVTLLGETESKSLFALKSSPAWNEYQRRQKENYNLDQEPDSGPISEIAAPTPEGIALASDRLSSLVKMDGIVALLIEEIVPYGYAGKLFEGNMAESAMLERRNLGYTNALRAAFLRREGVDPIDLIPPDVELSADTRQPFFLDDHARGDSTVYDGTDQLEPGFSELNQRWDKFRADANRTALQELYTAMRRANSRIPIWVLPRRGQDDSSEQRARRLTERLYLRWDSADAALDMPAASHNKLVYTQGSILFLEHIPRPAGGPDDSALQRARAVREAGFFMGLTLQRYAQPESKIRGVETCTFDLSSMPLSDAIAVLKACINPVI